MSRTVRRRVVVTGLVQGVFYRDGCRTEANRLGLAGWVRNRGDGAVEGVFEGAPEAVDTLIQWCRTGSARATVAQVQVFDEEPRGETGFQVTR